MILIAPDKYKGTLTAAEAARIIAGALGKPCVLAPMADGGEGTAEVLCRGENWVKHKLHNSDTFPFRPGRYFINSLTGEAVIDSSAAIGLQGLDMTHHNILTASSAPLGRVVRNLIDAGCPTVTIGIGGTATCDGGEGFLECLGDYKACSNHLIGLSDVRVPLLAPGDKPSALMFAPQKGATPEMLPLLADRLADVEKKYGPGVSEYDGAGGGLGYALASVIGCKVVNGAKYVLDSYHIDWQTIDLVITGEGCYDSQSKEGKVVSEVSAQARAHGIPVIILAGKVEAGCEGPGIIATDKFLPDLPLSHDTAALRLRLATEFLSGAAGK